MIEKYSSLNLTKDKLSRLQQSPQKRQQAQPKLWQIPSVLLTTLISVTGFGLLYRVTAIAQEYPGCFMINDAGQKMDLTIEVCRLFPEDLPEEVSASGTAAGVYAIPIVRRTNGEEGSPIINVTFNDAQNYEMILDTGATNTIITQEMADSLKVLPDTQGTFKVADGRDVQLGIGVVGSIAAGGLEFKQFTVAISPPQQKVALLGQDFFGKYDMSIKEKVVELRARSSS
ncbi:MAG: retropepsin-like aspartic protease [Microcoleaceae cyanobacterium MO_207.B10]|nr:retropepsin-like aspartic protease [Microcoleaceae cyanobacterium MO_207.B10]